MNRTISSGPVVLVVAFPISVHSARWIGSVRRRGCRIVLFPSVIQPLCPEHEPVRTVTCRDEVEALEPGEIGVYPGDGIPTLTAADLENPETYPHALPAFGFKPERQPTPDALCDAIAAIKPDLLHSLELQHAGYLVLECKERYTGVFPPWLASSWGSDIFMYRKMKRHRPILRRLVQEVDALHSDCARDMAWAVNAGFEGIHFPQMPATAGMDFSDVPRLSELTRPSRRKTILVKGYHGWSGRGLHILLALHLIAPQLKGFRIRVTHCPRPVKEMVERLACVDGLDISADPHLASHREALARLETARVVVGYGISDGISTTLLEAMTMGAFMVQANTCCGDEWITDRHTGLIVPPHDVVALSEAILLAATNDELVDRAMAINRRVVEERWNADTNGARIDRTYRDLVTDLTHA